MDDANPYEAPKHVVRPSPAAAKTKRRAGIMTYIGWVFIFVLNMAIPLLFSYSITREHGRAGVSVAVVFLLALGCYACAANRKLAAALMAGGVLVALTQMFPALHIVAGSIGISVGQALGLTDRGDAVRSPLVRSEFGGFVITFVTGGILMATAAGTGMFLRLITPARWWPRSDDATGA